MGEPVRADLRPWAILSVCPTCGASAVHDDLSEDDSGEYRVETAERFRHCEGCDEFLDVGWAGWFSHDAAQRTGGER